MSKKLKEFKMKKITSFLSLFTSLSTIFCCALPAIFVVLGFGAAFAGLVSAIPQLIWISEHKVFIFLFGGVMLISAGLFQWRAKQIFCPVDSLTGTGCEATRDWSLWVYFTSLGLYLVGFLFAFMAPNF